MKLIVSIIQPSRLEAVKDALSKVKVSGVTVSDVKGMGRQKGHTEVYRGHEYEIKLLAKVKLEIAVADELVDSTVDAIVQSARSGPDGKIGDGKVFVLDLDEVVRIRTGERGRDAL